LHCGTHSLKNKKKVLTGLKKISLRILTCPHCVYSHHSKRREIPCMSRVEVKNTKGT